MVNRTGKGIRRNWNRIILNILWALFAVELASQFAIYIVGITMIPDDFSVTYYFKYYVLAPDLVLVPLLVILELLYHRRFRGIEQALVMGSNLLALTIVTFINSEISVAPVLLLIPLLISTLYLKKVYLYFSTGVSLLYIVFKYAYALTDPWNITNFIVLVAVILATSLAGLGIITKGQELLEDLEESIQSEQNLKIKNILMDKLSKMDALTDLYNHKTFHEYMEKLVDHQKRHSFGMQLAVIDIDNFKKVNDTYGHWVGDLALKQVADCIKAHLDSDDFAARYGGEEFVIILTGKTGERGLEIIESIRKAIAAAVINEMDGKSVTVSIGAHLYRDGDTKEGIFQQADQALYVAKRTGKNRLVLSNQAEQS